MSTKNGKKYLDKNGLSYFRKKLKEELKNEQLWEQGENIDGTEGGVQIAYYGNAVGEASVSEGVAYNYKKSTDEIIPISIKSLSSEEKTAIDEIIGGNYNYVVKTDFSSIGDPIVPSFNDLSNKSFNLSVCEYVENVENTSILELSNVKNIIDISENTDIISIFTDPSEFSQLEITDNENLDWCLLELDDISVNKNSTYIIGISTGAFGIASHSEGYYTIANGDYSHAEGESSITEGESSHTEGYNTITTNKAEHAEGKYNKSNSGTISSIGIGTSNTDRNNAFEVLSDGNIYVKGLGDYDGTNAVVSNSEGKKGKSLQECVLNIDELVAFTDTELDDIFTEAENILSTNGEPTYTPEPTE